MDAEWRCVYENVDRANGAPPHTPGGGANWRFEEPMSPELTYDRVPLPSNKYPSQQPQSQPPFAHARPADNPAIPPRPPMTPKNLSGVRIWGVWALIHCLNMIASSNYDQLVAGLFIWLREILSPRTCSFPRCPRLPPSSMLRWNWTMLRDKLPRMGMHFAWKRLTACDLI